LARDRALHLTGTTLVMLLIGAEGAEGSDEENFVRPISIKPFRYAPRRQRRKI